jgi:hypothetical protein
MYDSYDSIHSVQCDSLPNLIYDKMEEQTEILKAMLMELKKINYFLVEGRVPLKGFDKWLSG